ncbi:MAG: AzlC family ABC transporter permease [Thermoactinomyces sp.]
MIPQQGQMIEQTGQNRFLKGAVTSIPIVIGYVPIAVALGLIATQSGISPFYTVLMSLLVFAGASQFMAVSMIMAGTGAVEIILATFILNFRHFIMSLSLMTLLKTIPAKWKSVLSMGITDETFTVTFFHREKASPPFVGGIMLFAYLSWVMGTILGCLLGDLIPESIGESMAVSLYAMFIGLLIPSVRKNWRIGFISVLSMLLCYFFSLFAGSGWAIVLATLLGSLAGLLFLRGDRHE